METFVEILKELIDDSNLSLRKLAKVSGVSANQYSRYLHGSAPTIAICIKIANYFNCSLDYLFGLDTNKNNTKYKSYNYDMANFLERYKALLNKNKITHYKFAKTQNFNESILRHWKAGKTPRLDILYLIAYHLNGSIDQLVGRY